LYVTAKIIIIIIIIVVVVVVAAAAALVNVAVITVIVVEFPVLKFIDKVEYGKTVKEKDYYLQ
jgi:flagellar basal body-associated protein FliL